MNLFYFPERLDQYIDPMSAEPISIGCSDAKVYRLRTKTGFCYLKMGPKSAELEQEYGKLIWLEGKLPVPHVIDWFTQDNFDYLLLSEIRGKMLCDDYYISNPEPAISVLAEGLHMLQSIPIDNCPMDNRLENVLLSAADLVQHNRVDMEDWESSSHIFSTPRDLLNHLCNHRPYGEELVFTHGDYCLPNILGDHGRISGFIDLGRAGVADLWQDIALCIRSMRYNFHTDKFDSMLMEQIGLPWDQERFDYYMLLDEIF